MELDWDWLRPVLTVPYVPTLGPIHPDALGPGLFAEVLAVVGTGRFLAHDKDQRWSPEKDERVLTAEIVHRPGLTLIPTLTRRGRGCVKLHHYSTQAPNLPDLLDTAAKIAADHGAQTARVLWFQTAAQAVPVGAACTRVQLKQFTHDEVPQAVVRDLREHPEAVVATFADFAKQMAAVGFAFLWDRFQAGRLDSPLLTLTSGNRVVGAIGPMEIMKDPVGAARLLPQYFGVLPDQRGHGHGRTLWRAAMHWGQANGAAYQLLQTELSGASDRLCQAEGLASLGFILTASTSTDAA
ncbi:GNAT family N-acetyltransferase [Kitasatospora sp. NPDC088391]|uniref:GNAT family N-acetyltransferase n=1 Tax=Kitasatospora sp. NPDC088391 TaxID=3364074 RepID=UPI0038261B0D